MNEFILSPIKIGDLDSLIQNAVEKALKAQTPAPLPEPEKFAYSIKEAADYFRVCPVTFHQWKKKGLVKHVQHGRKLIIDLNGTMANLQKRKGVSHE
jgi:hypothetical protein